MTSGAFTSHQAFPDGAMQVPVDKTGTEVKVPKLVKLPEKAVRYVFGPVLVVRFQEA